MSEKTVTIISLCIMLMPVVIACAGVSAYFAKKTGGTPWEWAVFGALDSPFVLLFLYQHDLEAFVLLSVLIVPELIGLYMSKKGYMGFIWGLAAVLPMFILFAMVAAPNEDKSPNLYLIFVFVVWVFSLITAYCARKRNWSPVGWFFISILTLGIPGLIIFSISYSISTLPKTEFVRPPKKENRTETVSTKKRSTAGGHTSTKIDPGIEYLTAVFRETLYNARENQQDEKRNNSNTQKGGDPIFSEYPEDDAYNMEVADILFGDDDDDEWF
ncbi:MAG: hypothetical protein MJ171_00280 [Clostridia bacterium]|nr:hypothetical protein [Clostridia bacterium]